MICNVAISLTTVFIISFLPFLCIILLSLFFCFNKYFLFVLVFFKPVALILLMHKWRYENGGLRMDMSSYIHSFINIQPYRPGWQEPEPSHVTGMALAHCILGKYLGVVCHCFPPLYNYITCNSNVKFCRVQNTKLLSFKISGYSVVNSYLNFLRKLQVPVRPE